MSKPRPNKVDVCGGRDVKPFRANCDDVRPYEGPMRMTSRELPLFDSVANELVQRSGTFIDYFAIDTEESDRDPLYGEASRRRFRGPFRIQAWIGYANSSPEARTEGFVNTWATSAWITRSECERAGFKPGEGDVFRVWNIPYFNADAVDDQNVPGGAFYYNVINVSDDGHLFDNPEFVGVTLSISRNTEFTPERRIEDTL